MMIPEYRGENFGWKAIRRLDPKRLRHGMEKFYQAMEIAMIEAERRPSGLPPDWRNRIFKYTYSV